MKARSNLALTVTSITLALFLGRLHSTVAAPAADPPGASPAAPPDARPAAPAAAPAAAPEATPTTPDASPPAAPADAPRAAASPSEATAPPEATSPAAPAPLPAAAAPKGAAPPNELAAVYRPLGTLEWSGGRIQFPIRAMARTEGVSSFLVDRYGNSFQSGAVISPLLRIGARYETIRPLKGLLMLMAEYEHDLPTGSWTSSDLLAGEGLPNDAAFGHSLRKAYARLSVGPFLHVGGGFMTSHWGLGLLANDGDHGWTPGSARFTDPRSGDIVIRGFLGTGPHTRARITGTLAFDKVWEDAVVLDGDSAYQFIASGLVGHGLPHQGGFFLVHRRQTAPGGNTLTVTAVDLAGRSEYQVGKAKLVLEAEGALIVGETTLGASPEFPTSKVLQIGAALRAALNYARLGGVIDLVYASGDQNSYDDSSNGFRTDPNFETGLLLFRYVQAAQTGRGYGTATDPLLTGVPPSGIDRLPTRGGMTDAVVFFPRIWGRPMRHLEVYGGVLVALAPVKNVDPFNTKLAGGAARNALDGKPGNYWGTEIDLGVRYRAFFRQTELDVGLEGGVLFPGSALRDASGDNPKPAYGGRLLVSYRL